jgi:gas vesicle protein
MSMESGSQPSADNTYKAFYQYLLDAIISKNEYDKVRNAQDVLKNKLPQNLSDVDNLSNSILTEIERFKSEKSSSLFNDTQSELKELISIALEKYKKTITEDVKKEISDMDLQTNSAKTNAMKNIQALLSMDILKIVDYSIYVKWIDGVYDSTVKYITEGGIEFEFSLNSRSVELFKEPLKFSFLEKGVKIPINSASNWAGKEAQVDYEKIDKFFLSLASLNKGNLFVTFADPDSDAVVTFVMSRGNENSFLSIEFKSDNQTIDITGNSALNNVLEADKIQTPLNRIYGTLKEMELNKTKLTLLHDNGNDILSTIAFRSLGIKIVELKRDILKSYIESFSNSKGKESSALRDLNERLKLAGETGDRIKQILEI